MAYNESSARKTYRFGKYEIIETTGTGGMGVVYRAEDRRLGRQVALKILRDDLRTQEHIVARFRREAEAFAHLDHPNIVHIFHVGTIGKIPYISMEFIEGASLNKIVRERGRLPWREVLEIGVQVADALDSAHQRQIIHRDIKPANILVDQDGKAFVTDFGIAKVLNAAKQLTVDGTRLGTPQYMCPERCQDREVTPASDIYSLGVLLFQCMTGRLPHEAESSSELIQKIIVEPPARLRKYAPEIPESVERLIAFMLEKEPENRPKSAGVLRGTIDRVLRGLPIDEHADELANALAAYRESLPTPTPHKNPSTDTSKPTPAPLGDRMKKRWFGISKWIRILLALAVVVSVVGVPAGLGYWALEAQRAAAIDYGPNHGIARWDTPRMLGFFQTETDTVSLCRLNARGFEIGAVSWQGGEAGALLELTGISGGPREGESAFFAVHPETSEVTVVRAPVPGWHAASYELVLSTPDALGVPGYFVRSASATLFCRAGEERPSLVVAEGPAAALAVHPGGERVALAYDVGSEDGWVLHEVGMDNPGGNVSELLAGAPVTALAYSPDGGRLACVRRAAAGGSELVLLEPGGGGDAGTVLLRGAVSLSAAAFRPDGGALCAALGTGEDATIQIVGLERGVSPVALGPGDTAQWHPQGGLVLTLAPDHAGNRQLFAVRTAAPYTRTQLTHLVGGVSRLAAFSEDGQYALSARPDEPTLVIVALSGVLQEG